MSEYKNVQLNEIGNDANVQNIEMVKCNNRKLINKIQEIIGYDFSNELLLLQAFTRRSYAVENGLEASSEELEFFGDKVLDYVMIRIMSKQFTKLDLRLKTPFISRFNEGELTKIKSNYVSKDYLSKRARTLGLDQYIFYGKSDTETNSASEDMMEALLGAVALDCDWDYNVLEELVKIWLNIRLDTVSDCLEIDPYDRLNSWHQRKYGCIPDYKVDRLESGSYRCLVLIHGQKGRDEPLEAVAETRSKAKSKAAEKASDYLIKEGLWCNLSDSGMEPDYDKSVNQLQELYQKQYIDETVFFFFEEDGQWKCECSNRSTKACEYGRNKVEAKKRAAYLLLVELFKACGMNRKEWDNIIQSQRNEYNLWLEVTKKGVSSEGIKQTCNGCLGLRYVDSTECEEGKCPLGYKYDAEKSVPFESCPRPKTHSQLAKVSEKRNSAILPALSKK